MPWDYSNRGQPSYASLCGVQKMSDTYIKKFGQCTIKVFKVSEKHPYPWRFAIIDGNNKEHMYVGMPNYCETRHSAIMRAWWRAKWINDGTIGNHYK